MQLSEVSNGRFMTHLRGRFEDLAAELRSGGARLESAFTLLSRDPVYRALRHIRPPVQDCQTEADLREALKSVEREAHELCSGRLAKDPKRADEIRSAVQTYVSTTRAFMDTYSEAWDEKSFLIVPVYVTTPRGQGCAALTYLRRATPSGDRAPGWSLVGLTQDTALQRENMAYFDQILNTMMGIFHFTEWQVPHEDPCQVRTDHVYKLLFDCGITRGKSHGGAMLVAFALAYLESKLGESYLNYVSPSPATFISVVVEPDGSLSRVDQAPEKVKCALAEFGPELHVFLHTDNRLDAALEGGISQGHLHYVSTAQELLGQALFLGENRCRSLEGVRARLFQDMSLRSRERIVKNLRKEYTRADIDTRCVPGGSVALTHTNHPCGILSRARFDRPTLEVRLGFESSAFLASESDPGLVFLVLDGSEAMDSAWSPGGQGVSRITDLVCAVGKRLYQRKARIPVELACTFLSSDHVFPVKPGAQAQDMERDLQQIRVDHKLRHRGAFLRPVVEHLASRYHTRTKRACVASDGDIFDHADLEKHAFSSFEWYSFRSADKTTDRIVLSTDGKGLRNDVLDTHFAQPRDVIRKVTLHMEQGVPLSWSPAAGSLVHSPGEHHSLEFSVEDEVFFEGRVQLPGWMTPDRITISATILRGGAEGEFILADHAIPETCEPLPRPEQGALSGADFDAWIRFGTPEWSCPACGRTVRHLREVQPLKVQEEPVFGSLRSSPGAYFLLEAGRQEWTRFQTGVDLGEIAIVIVNSQPELVERAGTRKTFAAESSHYWVEHAGRRLFVLPS